MIGQHPVREFYAESGFMTSTGNHAALIEELPDDVGLAIYDVVASDFYGIELPDDRQADFHTRPFPAMLDV